MSVGTAFLEHLELPTRVLVSYLPCFRVLVGCLLSAGQLPCEDWFAYKENAVAFLWELLKHLYVR